nr:ribonuclease H-like domain-containing protein [Tanacetum cinerariifolium]
MGILSRDRGLLSEKKYWDSGCSWHMTGNISYLSDYEPYDGGDNKNSVLFTDFECIVLGRDFKLKDDTNVLLRTPRQHNMYSTDLNNIVPHKDLTCLVAKASADECMLWHRRLGHLNFKTMNKLVRHNIVRGLPSKCFENDHTCVACLKGKQHKATCKNKLVNSVFMPIHTLHMGLFRPTSNGNNKKSLGRDSKGGIIILPPPAVKARFGGNEESNKMRKTMLKQEFSEFSVSKEEGLHKGYNRFQKILSQLNQIQAKPDNDDAKPDNDDVNMKFLRALPPSWSQVALTLKTRGGLKYLSFDDLYNELRSLEIDVKGGSSYGSRDGYDLTKDQQDSKEGKKED